MDTVCVQKSSSGRIWYLERLRVLACLAVVLIHCLATPLDNMSVQEVGLGRALAWTELLVSLGRWAVPVFLMVTGALLLDPSREMGWRKVSRYVRRMVVVLLSFGTLFALMELAFDARALSPSMLPEAFLRVLQGRSWAHLWYLYDLIGVYLLLPLLRSFVASNGRGSQRVMLAVLFLTALVVPTFNSATGAGLARLAWLGSSVFYVLLGWHLHRFGAGLRAALPAGAACLAACAVVAGGGVAVRSEYLSWAWSPSSPLVAVYSAAVFLAARRWGGEPRSHLAAGVVAAVSSLSFAVYLVHPVFCNLLYKALGWLSAPLPPVAFELSTYALVLSLSLASAWLLKKTPLVRGLL